MVFRFKSEHICLTTNCLLLFFSWFRITNDDEKWEPCISGNKAQPYNYRDFFLGELPRRSVDPYARICRN